MVALIHALQGLTNSEAQFNIAASKIARQSMPAARGQDFADLSAAVVALIQARNSFDASIKTIQVADEIQQSLLSILA